MVFLCDRLIIENILKLFDPFYVLTINTSYDSSIVLNKSENLSICQTEFAKIIGSLMFLMNYYTLPHIVYIVSRVSICTHNPSVDNSNTIRCLLRYYYCSLHLSIFPLIFSLRDLNLFILS